MPTRGTKASAVVQATTKPPRSQSNRKSDAVKSQPEKVLTANWYDHPEWYELGFLKDTPREAKFLEAVFKKYVKFPVRRILETGCGSGRLIREMVRRGYLATGLDLNATALDYCKAKLTAEDLQADLVQGDMTKFEFDEPFDAVINAINTFRHLESETAALKHLKCVASHLKPGGVFVLSLHLLPKDGDLWGTERWGTRTPELSVSYALKVLEVDLKSRLERLRITMNVKQDGQKFQLVDEILLRLYEVQQLKDLLAKAKQLELVGVFDFWFDLKQPRRLSQSLCDTVLVLRRV